MSGSAITVRCLDTIGEREIEGLCDVLIDCVEGGASVSFMLPITRAKAEAFWPARRLSAHAASGSSSSLKMQPATS